MPSAPQISQYPCVCLFQPHSKSSPEPFSTVDNSKSCFTHITFSTYISKVVVINGSYVQRCCKNFSFQSFMAHIHSYHLVWSTLVYQVTTVFYESMVRNFLKAVFAVKEAKTALRKFRIRNGCHKNAPFDYVCKGNLG